MNFVSLHPVEQQCQINFHINARNGGSRLWRGPQFKVQINLFTGTIHCEPNQVALNEFLLVWLEFQVKPLNRHLKLWTFLVIGGIVNNELALWNPLIEFI